MCEWMTLLTYTYNLFVLHGPNLHTKLKYETHKRSRWNKHTKVWISRFRLFLTLFYHGDQMTQPWWVLYVFQGIWHSRILNTLAVVFTFYRICPNNSCWPVLWPENLVLTTFFGWLRSWVITFHTFLLTYTFQIWKLGAALFIYEMYT